MASNQTQRHYLPRLRINSNRVPGGIRFIFIFLFIILFSATPTLPANGASAQSRLSVQLQAKLAAFPSGEMIPVIVTLKSTIDPQQAAGDGTRANRQERIIRVLQAQAEATQKDIQKFLEDRHFAGKTGKVKYYWIFNGISLQVTADIIQALAARDDIQSIDLDQTYEALSWANTSGTAWDNLGKINAPQVWALGFQGQGVVLANLDTGVDYTHPDLQASWRGGNNSWYDPADPAGTHPTPADQPVGCPDRGHGTATMGIMAGNTTRVAPRAKWIAVKIFSDDYTTDPLHPCPATTSTILSGFQWVMDPDGDPATADAPQVVNNSWGAAGCDTSKVFQPALEALRAAGILPIFAAGNNGPILGSSTFPANYPEAFAVGATDSANLIASYSSRGPNNCVTPASLFPALVAPGDFIQTTGPGGTYVLGQGTSFAAPHAAGALALLLSAFPTLTIQQQQDALVQSAVDLGTAGPDYNYGVGLLDVWGAYNQLNDATIGFASTNQVVSEAAGSISITATRSGGLAYPVSVDYAVIGGTAAAGANYILAAGSLIFAAEETQKLIPVQILDDGQPGGEKTVIVELSNAQMPNGIQTAAVNSAANQTVLTILNTDPWKVMLPLVNR